MHFFWVVEQYLEGSKAEAFAGENPSKSTGNARKEAFFCPNVHIAKQEIYTESCFSPCPECAMRPEIDSISLHRFALCEQLIRYFFKIDGDSFYFSVCDDFGFPVHNQYFTALK